MMLSITFINPQTGEYYEVKPTKACINAAYKLGFIPADIESADAADKIDAEER